MSLSVINYSLKPLSVTLLSQQRYKAISRFDFYVILQTIFLKFGIDINQEMSWCVLKERFHKR